MASACRPPPKSQAYEIVLPQSSSVKQIVSAVLEIVGAGHIHSIQQRGNQSSFQVSMKSRAAMDAMLAAGAITFGSSSVPIVPIGPQVIQVSVLPIPIFVSGKVLVQTIALYAKVQFLARAIYQDFHDIETGTRRLSVIMVEGIPIANSLRVGGQRAAFDYRGVKRVCRRCRAKRHIRSQ